MKRTILWSALAASFLAATRPSQADVFDRHTNSILQKGLESPDVQPMKSLTSEQAFQQDRALPGVVGAFVIVRTNEGRNAKLLIQWARQKTENGKSIPMILIERYACYKAGEERATASVGQNLSFFPGFRLSLDIGQLAPPELAADLGCKLTDQGVVLEPLGNAKLYLVKSSLLPRAEPKVDLKPGEGPFDPMFFAGTYKLNDDGKRTGTLELQVKEGGEITGAFYSDGSGQKYEVTGKVGSPKHSVQFTIRFPRTEQIFHGWLFTGDARGLTGYSTMQEREAGFYAVRSDEK